MKSWLNVDLKIESSTIVALVMGIISLVNSFQSPALPTSPFLGVTKGSYVNVRDIPSVYGSKVLGKLNQGQEVWVLEIAKELDTVTINGQLVQGHWYKVSTTIDCEPVTAWVFGNLIGVQSVPVP